MLALLPLTPSPRPTPHAHTTNPSGFPRIGPKREVKKALEAYWKKELPAADLLATVHAMQALAWTAQADAGIALVGVDGTLYDQV